MTDSQEETPNPGSDEAIKLGCKCPVLDNAHGKGWMGGVKGKDGETLFVVSGNCNLHAHYEVNGD